MIRRGWKKTSARQLQYSLARNRFHREVCGRHGLSDPVPDCFHQDCRLCHQDSGLWWSPRTQQPSARLSPPPARRDYQRGPVADQAYHSTSLDARSRTPSPSRTNARSPAPQYYGTANLTDRSRSPSPDTGAVPPPAAPARRPEHPGTVSRRRRRRRRRGDVASTGQMPRVLPSPTVTPHHSPDRFNFPRLFTSPSTSPPWSPLTRQQFFHLPGEDRDRDVADQGPSSLSAYRGSVTSADQWL